VRPLTTLSELIPFAFLIAATETPYFLLIPQSVSPDVILWVFPPLDFRLEGGDDEDEEPRERDEEAEPPELP